MIVALASLAGVLAGTLATYLVARLAKSGRVATTEAATLWEESSAMRAELRAEVQAWKDSHKSCTDELTVQKAALADAVRRIEELEGKH